jgi:hypothetical protein
MCLIFKMNVSQGNGEDAMKNRLPTLAAAALFAMSIVPFANNASATPVADALALKNAAPTNIETVRWRHRGWRGGGWGPGIGAGLLGGAIIGGMLAAPYYGYDDPYYAYEPGPYGPGPYYSPGYGGNAVAYCMQRFRSYDPNSGTYVGYDGLRHSCP